MQTRAPCWPQLGLPRLPEFPQFTLPGIAAVAENYFPSAGSIQQQEDLDQVTFLRTSKDYQVIITPLAVCYCGYQSSLNTSGSRLQQLQSPGHTLVKLSAEKAFHFLFSLQTSQPGNPQICSAPQILQPGSGLPMLSNTVVLNLPNAAILYYSSSWFGDAQT